MCHELGPFYLPAHYISLMLLSLTSLILHFFLMVSIFLLTPCAYSQNLALFMLINSDTFNYYSYHSSFESCHH